MTKTDLTGRFDSFREESSFPFNLSFWKDEVDAGFLKVECAEDILRAAMKFLRTLEREIFVREQTPEKRTVLEEELGYMQARFYNRPIVALDFVFFYMLLRFGKYPKRGFRGLDVLQDERRERWMTQAWRVVRRESNRRAYERALEQLRQATNREFSDALRVMVRRLDRLAGITPG